MYANFVTWKLKPGMREEWMDKIDDLTEEGKDTKGFKGIFALESTDDPNTVYILSLWDSEESLDAAMDGLIKDIWNKLGNMRSEPPVAKKLKVRELAAQTISIPS